MRTVRETVRVWYWNPARDDWFFERAVPTATADESLAQLRAAHPDVVFSQAHRRPRLAPTSPPQLPEDNSLTAWVGPAILDAVYAHVKAERTRTNYRVSTGDVVRAALLEYFAKLGKPVDMKPGPDTPIPRGGPGTPIPRPPVRPQGSSPRQVVDFEYEELKKLAEEDPSLGWSLRPEDR